MRNSGKFDIIQRTKDPQKSFYVTKSGKDALFLEYVNECSDKDCPFDKRCGYMRGGICGFEASFYVRIVQFLLRMEREGRIGEAEFMHTSIAILPLYRQLLQLYKLECTLNGKMMYKNKIHPVYKEIRAVLSQLGEMWKHAAISERVLTQVAGSDMTFNIKNQVYEFIRE